MFTNPQSWCRVSFVDYIKLPTSYFLPDLLCPLKLCVNRYELSLFDPAPQPSDGPFQILQHFLGVAAVQFRDHVAGIVPGFEAV